MNLNFHQTLTPERWTRFAFADQVIMVGNELQRAANALKLGDDRGARASYWRALDLVDLTVATLDRTARGRRKELLRFREVLAALFCEERPSPDANRALLRALLQFTPRSAEQIPYVCPEVFP